MRRYFNSSYDKDMGQNKKDKLESLIKTCQVQNMTTKKLIKDLRKEQMRHSIYDNSFDEVTNALKDLENVDCQILT